MKVIIKKPNEQLKTIEVKDLKEINKLLDNVDENGKGINYTGSDFRTEIFEGIDMHVNGNSIFNANLPMNFWDAKGNNLYCGNVIFAGYDSNSRKDCGVCSLTDEQIEYLKQNIRSVLDIDV